MERSAKPAFYLRYEAEVCPKVRREDAASIRDNAQREAEEADNIVCEEIRELRCSNGLSSRNILSYLRVAVDYYLNRIVNPVIPPARRETCNKIHC